MSKRRKQSHTTKKNKLSSLQRRIHRLGGKKLSQKSYPLHDSTITIYKVGDNQELIDIIIQKEMLRARESKVYTSVYLGNDIKGDEVWRSSYVVKYPREYGGNGLLNLSNQVKLKYSKDIKFHATSPVYELKFISKTRKRKPRKVARRAKTVKRKRKR